MRVQIFLRYAADTVDGGITQRTTEFYVGDAPDSTGTASQLDSDASALTFGGASVYNGGATFMLIPASISAGGYDSRVQAWGRLIWADAMPGTHEKAIVRFVYSDG